MLDIIIHKAAVGVPLAFALFLSAVAQSAAENARFHPSSSRVAVWAGLTALFLGAVAVFLA